MQLNTPVLFLIFNRPDVTEKVFGQIKKVQPRQLFVAADGPRATHSQDVKKCNETRQLVLDMIDWECEIKTLFRDKNLGCGLAVSQAITWFFEHVEEGIILEDDVYPDLSFFFYCEQLLEKYHKEKKVYGITGLNWQNGKKRGKASYYFSKFPGIWGWATWSDRWKVFKFDPSNEVIQYLNKKKIDALKLNKKVKINLIKDFKSIGKVDSWDYAWRFTVFSKKGLIAVPQVNLTSNIGFGEGSTHTTDNNSPLSGRKVKKIDFPLVHPLRIELHKKADRYMERRFYSNKFPMLKRLFIKMFK